MGCAGSLQACAAQPWQDVGDAAKEGTVAHALAALTLGALATVDESMVDDEMRQGVAVYVDYVQGLMPPMAWWPEMPVNIPAVHSTCKGTADLYYFDAATGTLHVFDFKYGRGLVEVFENWQLLCYAAGLITPTTINVVLHIVQPRAWHPDGPCRTWSLTAAELHIYINAMSARVQEALNPNPVCTTGPWCLNCRALVPCNTVWKSATRAIEFSETMNLTEATPEMIAAQYILMKRAFTLIKKRLVAAEEIGLHMYKTGKLLPGISHSRTRGSSKWLVDEETLFSTGDAMGVEMYKKKPLTPNQAKEAGLPEAMVSQLSEKIPGRLTLTIDGGNKAAQIFKRN